MNGIKVSYPRKTLLRKLTEGLDIYVDPEGNLITQFFYFHIPDILEELDLEPGEYWGWPPERCGDSIPSLETLSSRECSEEYRLYKTDILWQADSSLDWYLYRLLVRQGYHVWVNELLIYAAEQFFKGAGAIYYYQPNNEGPILVNYLGRVEGAFGAFRVYPGEDVIVPIVNMLGGGEA